MIFENAEVVINNTFLILLFSFIARLHSNESYCLRDHISIKLSIQYARCLRNLLEI